MDASFRDPRLERPAAVIRLSDEVEPQWRRERLEAFPEGSREHTVLTYLPFGPFTVEQFWTYNLAIRERFTEPVLREVLDDLVAAGVLSLHDEEAGVYMPAGTGLLMLAYRGGRVSPALMHDAVTGEWIAVRAPYLRPTTIELNLSDDESVPAYQRVATAIRAKIASDDLPPLSALPSIRDLAAAYGLDADIIRRAYDVLAEEGLVTLEPRRGASVTDLETRKRAREREVAGKLRPGRFLLGDFVRRGPHEVTDAMALASALLYPEGRNIRDRAERDVLAAIILHLIYQTPRKPVTLSTLRAQVEELALAATPWRPDENSPPRAIDILQAFRATAHDDDGTRGWRDAHGRPSRTHPFIAGRLGALLNAPEPLINQAIVRLFQKVALTEIDPQAIAEGRECSCATLSCGHADQNSRCDACGCAVPYVMKAERRLVTAVIRNTYIADGMVRVCRDPNQLTVDEFIQLCEGITTTEVCRSLTEALLRRGALTRTLDCRYQHDH